MLPYVVDDTEPHARLLTVSENDDEEYEAESVSALYLRFLEPLTVVQIIDGSFSVDNFPVFENG